MDRISDHATSPDGTLRVHVYWTGYRHLNCTDATEAQQATLHTCLGRAARLGLPHTSAYPTRAALCHAAPAVGAAEVVAGAPPPAVRA